MRLILVSIGLFVLFLTHLTGQSKWEVIHEAPILSGDLHFISEDTALISDGRQIFKTYNGGENWTLVKEDLNFYHIDFFNDSIGWAIAHEETTTECDRLYKTQDGGQHWTKQDFCIEDIDDLEAITDSVIYLLGRQKIFKSSNGGQNWKEITPFPNINYNEICFFNRDTGLVIGVTEENKRLICRTLNGGDTWDIIPTEFEYVSNPVLLDNSTGYFIGSRRLYKTTDMFETWAPVCDTLNGIRDFYFFNDDTVIALYNTDSRRAGDKYIIKSTDGGVTWKETDHMDLSSGWDGVEGHIFAVNETAYYFSTYDFMIRGTSIMSILLKSEDFGDRWSSLYVGCGLNDIHFLDANTGFATNGYGGFHILGGLLLKTLDGGKSLQTIKSTTSILDGLHFFNRSYGVIRGKWGTNPWYTHNGGKTWMLDKQLDILNYYSMNSCNGWMMGMEDSELDDSVLVMKTKDGGHTWDTTHRICRRFTDIDEDLNMDQLGFASLIFTTEETGFIVGERGLILSLSGPGDWERIESGTTLPLNKIMFVNEEIGFISGGYCSEDEFHPMLMKTNDGGETWIQIPGMNFVFNDFWMEDEHHGWAIGDNPDEEGILLETLDGGKYWTKANSSLPGGLNAFHFSNGTLWAVGENTVILKYMLSDTSANGEPDTCITSDVMWDPTYTFARLQNYPNPFASTTTIRYSVPIFGPVEICVYDMSGRKVLTLYSKKQKEGLYEIVCNAEDLQPGIYFCELRTIQARHISKMILMR